MTKRVAWCLAFSTNRLHMTWIHSGQFQCRKQDESGTDVILHAIKTPIPGEGDT